MKKLISITLATALLICSLFTFNVFAETTKTEALLTKLNESKEFSVSLKAGDIALFGENSKASDTFYVKGNNIAYEYKAGFLNVRAIVNGSTAYAYLPNLPFFYVKLENTGLNDLDVWALLENATNLTQSILAYQGSYSETVDGKAYYVEEYNDRATVTSKFYYEGDDLKWLNVVDSSNGNVTNTYFESISFTVSDSVFSVPKAAFDLTFLLEWIFSMFIK